MSQFSQLVQEAISLQLFDKYMRLSNDEGELKWDRTYLEKEFKASPLEKDRQAFRLFLPYPGALKIRIIRFLEKINHQLISYKDKKCFDKAELQPRPRHPNDKSTGVVPLRPPREKNLGSVLQDYANRGASRYGLSQADQAEAKRLMELFQKDKIGRDLDDGTVTIDPNEKPKLIVLSRHPYDVMSMSTGREWTSCQDLVTGGMCRFVPGDVEGGTIIAYLIYEDDHTQRKVLKNSLGSDSLARPISRILIKPYINNKGETAFAISAKTYPPEKYDANFYDAVKVWVEGFNRSRNQSGKFEIDPRVYMGYKGGTQELSATEFDLNSGEMSNVVKGEMNPYLDELQAENIEDFIDEISENPRAFTRHFPNSGYAIELIKPAMTYSEGLRNRIVIVTEILNSIERMNGVANIEDHMRECMFEFFETLLYPEDKAIYLKILREMKRIRFFIDYIVEFFEVDSFLKQNGSQVGDIVASRWKEIVEDYTLSGESVPQKVAVILRAKYGK
jgi:hypothetical protein